MTKIAVMGSGSWGTAFSLVLADAGNNVVLWGRREELATGINEQRQNLDYLPGIELPESITATINPADALTDAEVVVFAVPSQTLRDNLQDWGGLVPADAILVSLMKGIELGSKERMSQVIAEVTGASPERIAIVSGPNLAKEIANREPAASVIACSDEATAQRLQKLCHTRSFRPYTNTDVIGCELAGATKNIIALAVGVCDGLGFGDNTKASVITRGLAETTRLGIAMGADLRTFAGLAGIGDLVATCSSPLSRNRTFGERMGRGETVADIVAATRQVAEGVKSVKPVAELAAQFGVDMPIVDAVNGLIDEKLDATAMVTALISRTAKPESV